MDEFRGLPEVREEIMHWEAIRADAEDEFLDIAALIARLVVRVLRWRIKLLETGWLKDPRTHQ